MMEKIYVGVIVKVNDEVLLCKRSSKASLPGIWSVPAGSVEKGETTKEAAVREFHEETDIIIGSDDLKFVGLVPRTSRDGKFIKGWMYVYLLESNAFLYPDLENAKDGKEHSDCGYFTYEDIQEMNTGKFFKKLLEAILNRV
jgi:ADP-ribose pyrophosphatase YjhB (NUDIX family)